MGLQLLSGAGDSNRIDVDRVIALNWLSCILDLYILLKLVLSQGDCATGFVRVVVADVFGVGLE
jgi:hypothetical protein